MELMPELSVIVQFTIATIIFALTPGPDMTLFVGRTLSQGRAAGLACMSGAITGLAIHTTLVALGLSALLVASPTAFLILKVAGGVYLLWLAWQAIRHGSAFQPAVSKQQPQSLMRNWIIGITMNLINPKIALFFMTFLPQFVSASDPHAVAKLFFLGGNFILVSLPIVVAIIVAADRVAAMLRGSPRVTRIMDWLFAGVFSAFAIRIFAARAH